jgi:hypothetical protein
MLTSIFTLLVPLLTIIPSTNGLTAPNNVGKLPALGWNSWNAYGCNISEGNFLDAAQKLIDLGLKVGIIYQSWHFHFSFSLKTSGCWLRICQHRRLLLTEAARLHHSPNSPRLHQISKWNQFNCSKSPRLGPQDWYLQQCWKLHVRRLSSELGLRRS